MPLLRFTRLEFVTVATTLCAACGPNPSMDPRRLQVALAAEVAKPNVHNALARVEVGGRTVFAGAAGTLSENDRTEIGPDTPFRSASVTKLFTAVTVLRLVERGSLSLDQPIGSLLRPELVSRLHVMNGVSRGGELTIRQLLGHTTGIANIDEDPTFNGDITRDPGRVWKPEELLEYAMRLGPKFAPGQGQLYSSPNYMVLGLIISAVAGEPYHVVVRREVLQPLELKDTFEETHEGRGPRPIAHSYIGALDVTLAHPSFENADGGFVTTTADLARFGRALARGEVFTRPETLKSMLEPQGAEGIGLGPWLGQVELARGDEPLLYHPGFWGVLLAALPKRDAVVVLTVNQAEADYNALLGELLAAVP